jgi:putative PIN family toxin of toxin-antitoxin system
VRAKVVFDSNVFIAAAANPGGYARLWLRAAATQSRSFDLFSSEAILSEVARVLTRMRVNEDTITALLAEIRGVASIVEPTEHIEADIRDPNDNIVLECAVVATAHMIVSADKDLIQLRHYREIAIYPTTYLKYAFPQDFSNAA